MRSAQPPLACRRPLGLLCLAALSLAAVAAAAQQAGPPPEFERLAGQLSPQGVDESPQARAAEEQALQMLDHAALAELNPAAPDLEVLNRHLAQWVTHRPPVGEGYRVARLPGSALAYALVANFGIGGPSAVRVYAGPAGGLALAGRIDRYAEMDFIDDYLELLPWNGPAPLFVTVAGRSDGLKTGVFTAWLFDGRGVHPVWTSDVLQQSSYEMAADGFRLTYCGEMDADDLSVCRRMQRDRFVWQEGAWKQVESTPLAAPAARP